MTHSLLGQAYRTMGRKEDATREIETAQRLQTASQPKLESLR
jgi:Flp pilus assembly protein TadD